MNKIDLLRPLKSTPYEDDYARWCEEQGALLRAGRLDQLDRENLAEEIESLGRSDKREIASRMRVLLSHLLKWLIQPEKRSLSWARSIIGAREEIRDLIEESPSLKTYPPETVRRAYQDARREAAVETGLSIATISHDCPFSIEQILDPVFYPGDNQPEWLAEL